MDKAVAKLSHDEAKRRVAIFRLIALALAILLTVGSVFYHYVEEWSWIDSIYFSVVSLATVGYGDFAPKTDIGKIFTIAYLIIGLGIFAAFVSNLFQSRVAKHTLEQEVHGKHKGTK